ncbi:glycosyltransferase [Natrinema salsiterrestre]|uniref:Glycosyltransferase n=1 Tax=Natrinema salsiterrestre TaxID=2950540 RepID=A0A9Q4L1G0_9EURY|nr:glycosyltransferase [Natrinema salsiterrestre]MDF9745867.1 glycosyltransferase [Natrinema salsiterrestre]
MDDTSKGSLSVVLPVYSGDESTHLDSAIKSVIEQTRNPDEVVLVQDGPVNESIEQVITNWCECQPEIINHHEIPKNQGLGNALRVGVEHCSSEFVARMDADDISYSNRFETQLLYLRRHPEVDIVGGYIQEFSEKPEKVAAVRTVPLDHDDIRAYARHRNPMNHVTVMFRREAVLNAGNYHNAEDPMEDYWLWARMLRDGATFANVADPLVKVRAGDELYKRRGGWKYARKELCLQRDLYRWGISSLPRCLFNAASRAALRLVPNSVRGDIYQRFARADPDRV